MERIKIITTHVLLIFALISIGFIFGKHSVKTQIASPEKSSEFIDKANRVAVYYLHSTFRCVTCNTIEKMTKELLDAAYAQEMKKGEIIWKEEDFQQNEKIAQKFEVLASCVVVAQIINGEISDYRRLDEVWTKMSDQEEFNKYISKAIDRYIGKNGGVQ
jgi:hypothetical protein